MYLTAQPWQRPVDTVTDQRVTIPTCGLFTHLVISHQLDSNLRKTVPTSTTTTKTGPRAPAARAATA